MPAKLTVLDHKRLRWLLALFFISLAVPTAILVRQAQVQMKWESFHQHQELAQELSMRIDAHLHQLIDTEENRSFSDYAFLVMAGDPAANYVQRSPLSEFPLKSSIPGLVGYFQVDARGVFGTPLLPQQGESPAYGISGEELSQRQAAQTKVLEILARNRLVREREVSPLANAMPSPAVARPDVKKDQAAPGYENDQATQSPTPVQNVVSQAVFDELSQAKAPMAKSEPSVAGSKEEAKGLAGSAESSLQALPEPASKLAKRSVRKERVALPAPQGHSSNIVAQPARVTTFESEIDPLEFNRLDTGHFVLFRKVWRDGQRYIQGMIVEVTPFLQDVVEAEFRDTLLSRMSDLAVIYQGTALTRFSALPQREYLDEAGGLRGDRLYASRLSAPFSEMELLFTLTQLPAGPGSSVVYWLAVILAIVLCGGFLLMYRLGLRLINLARQQQDFVSAVSHELKTPLTSIRMYGEMLCEGWVSEDKKPVYYEFIYAESERLSRLIANVLQLARMTRNRLDIALKPYTVGELMDGIQAKIKSPVERAGFGLHLEYADEITPIAIKADADHFAQIIINLVDNALKFSAKSAQKQIDIGCLQQRDKTLMFYVRDYGPGVPKGQMKKIFRLFYRMENELTRETIGTGIGLALVKQLALAMGAKVELINREPGAEFQLIFVPESKHRV